MAEKSEANEEKGEKLKATGTEIKAEINPALSSSQTPMEIGPSALEPERRGPFRKLFLKLGEKVGTIKVSELDPEYLTLVKDADAYKEVLCRLAESIMHVLQQNPTFVPEVESKMEFDCPTNGDPMEVLKASLESMRENFSAHPAALNMCIDCCAKIAELRRAYLARGRRALHYIRTFINVEYVALNDQRQTLIARRQEMDFAKHEYVNNPIDKKKINYEKALAKFSKQLDVVFETLSVIPYKKEKHRLELIKVLDEMRKFHGEAATQCFRVCQTKW